ncbi:transporter [Borreliella mayonii]|uniref:Probable queuosine precursor transporter n=1 Tax=Borreliella mayonii TaxID=1674146 RepID=A0AAC9KY85_9SPIR|nr:queuosine precursor transporter [Borreliella mayonii]APS98284.1 transporter [Borreliella mayonii]APS99418.1 transporter [Borreliella mayonii]
MFNEILWFGMLFTAYTFLIIVSLFFKKNGLFVWVAVAIIIANIQVLKQITIFGINATLGNIIYASSYMATDILSEFYGKKTSKEAVYIGFISFIVFAVLTNAQIHFMSNRTQENFKSLENIFSSIPALLLASLVAYLVSQLNDVYLYQFIKKKFPKFLFFRINGSTLISGLIDTTIFVSIATYFKIFPKQAFLDIVISTYIIKGLAGFLGTPFIYLAKYIKLQK